MRNFTSQVQCLDSDHDWCVESYTTLLSTDRPIDHYQSKLPDIGHLATWSVSSYKYGFNVDCLRDDDPETFWQYVVQHVHRVCLIRNQGVTDHNLTTLRFSSIKRSLFSLNDLQEVRYVGFEKPNEWLDFDVSMDLSDDGTNAQVPELPIGLLALMNFPGARYIAMQSKSWLRPTT
ncbi:APC10 domain-containing protein [Rhizoctonia solani AG-1 IA]|uniref:APC10 domain-containing protein n=1 Tax=Thanatephorus cucumeris (strain AG1-IA) TaxID=983506 RepID=L8WQN6_THACA|nr:APC10 domain-containing protein [Rhizoctonia solani AG-1 IA]